MAEVSVVNTYRLRDGAGFGTAVAALVLRVQTEGHPGVRSYWFFRPTADEGRAVVTYDSPEAWVGHHDRIMDWPEMAALRASADLADILLFGEITAPMRDWIDRMGVADRVRHQRQSVAGFRR